MIKNILAALVVALIAASCNKTDLLRSERDLVEAEIKSTHEQMSAIDAKFEALRTSPISYGMTLDRHREEVAKRNAKLMEETAFLTLKCTSGEAFVKELRPRLEAYKAKNLR